MTDQLRQAANQALEALEGELWLMLDKPEDEQYRVKYAYLLTVITALRTALEQQAEPVAWMFQHDETGRMNYVGNDGIHNPTMFLEMNPRYALVCPLYTAPPQRPWQGLTEFQFAEIYNKWNDTNGSTPWGLNQALEAKLKERNK